MNAEIHALAGAYALNALPADERDLFRAHLEQCPTCRREVQEFTSTAARLGADAAEAAPARMRTQVMERVAHTRQWAPIPRTEDSSPGDDSVVRPMRRRRTVRLLAAAAALVLVALAGGVAIGRWLVDDPARDPIGSVVAADDAQIGQARLDGGGTLTLISSAEQQSAVVMAESLPELSPEQIYQLWIIDDSQVRSADVFFDGTGQAQVQLLDDVDPGEQVAITREPQGGSPQPTMDPLGMVALT
ncbi:MAG TPA: anti-sigma factor [Nocardioidaceae bacterium]|nr:anti-sigma factor [Nocardioidaceae bacterium]